jgi:hypothetical protein
VIGPDWRSFFPLPRFCREDKGQAFAIYDIKTHRSCQDYMKQNCQVLPPTLLTKENAIKHKGIPEYLSIKVSHAAALTCADLKFMTGVLQSPSIFGTDQQPKGSFERTRGQSNVPRAYNREV